MTAPGAPAGMPTHITIAEARQSQPGEVVKVGGDVVPGTISWDNASRSLRFTLANGEDRLTVVYRGQAPDDFKPGLAIVAEGTYRGDVTFQATSLTPRTSPLCKACHQ